MVLFSAGVSNRRYSRTWSGKFEICSYDNSKWETEVVDLSNTRMCFVHAHERWIPCMFCFLSMHLFDLSIFAFRAGWVLLIFVDLKQWNKSGMPLLKASVSLRLLSVLRRQHSPSIAFPSPSVLSRQSPVVSAIHLEFWRVDFEFWRVAADSVRSSPVVSKAKQASCSASPLFSSSHVNVFYAFHLMESLTVIVFSEEHF